jgi:hypothetical protein
MTMIAVAAGTFTPGHIALTAAITACGWETLAELSISQQLRDRLGLLAGTPLDPRVARIPNRSS